MRDNDVIRRSDDIAELEALARATRRHIINSVHIAGAGHIGGPLSVTDLLVALFFRVMRIDPGRPDWPERDRFILSKGHSAIALYAVMALRGYFPEEELTTFDAMGSRLQGHPDMTVLPGLDMSTGSLGQGLSAGLGMALAAKRKKEDHSVWVVLGDGEIQEGQVWEAAHVAARYGTDNLKAILDFNKLQQYGWAGNEGSRQVPIDNPAERFAAFGWDVREIDGHDFHEILQACDEVSQTKGKPSIIVAHTVKGKGFSLAENDFNWHSKIPTEDELRLAFDELQDGREDNVHVNS